MMIMKRHISYAVVGTVCSVAMGLWGCSKQTVERLENEKYPVQFSCVALSDSEAASAETKVTGENFDAGDRVGLYAYPSSGSIFGEGEDVWGNVPYVALGGSSQGQLAVDGGKTPICFPADDAKTMTFKGYYPYSEEMAANGTLALELADQRAGQKGVILYSDNATEKTRTADFIRLEFRYALAQVVVNLQYDQTTMPDEDVAHITAVTLSGTGVQTSGVFSVADGTVSATAATDGEGTVALKAGVSTTKGTVLSGGGKAATGLVIAVVTPVHTYVAKPKDIEDGFEAGKQYIYNVTLKGGGEAEIAGDGEASILPWEEGNDTTQPPIIGEQEN